MGTILLGGIFSSGRIFCHTLLFAVALWLLGTYLFWMRRRTWGLTLAFGSSIHLILDEMWLNPRTLLWPLYSWSFERADISDWLAQTLHWLVSDPHVFVPEIVGFLIVFRFMLLRLRKRRGVSIFARKAQLAE